MTSAHDKGRHSAYNRSFSSKHGKLKHNNDKNVFLPKKRRTMTVEKQQEMDKLFDSISNDPFFENELPTQHDSGSSSRNDPAQDKDEARKQQEELENQHLFLDNNHLGWLYDNPSDDDSDMMGQSATASTHDLSNMASQFLDQEQRDKLNEALDSTDHTDSNGVHYRFFSKRCQLPAPSIKNETSKIKDPAVLPKYIYVVDKSRSDAKRKLLLSSGMLPLWYQHGWNCPHSVYQWLMEVVAFDKDLVTAKQAMAILFSFWSNLPTVKLPFHPAMSDDVNYDRNMSIATFSYILKSYGALKLPAIPNDDDDDDDVTMTTDPLDDTLPFIQLDWTLQLLSKSLQLWPEAYTTPQLHDLAKILLGIGMDGLGVVILRTLQDCFQACLLALPLESWEHQVRLLGCSLCDEYRLVELQIRLTRAANPVCRRSSYLCRVIALVALELAHLKDMEEFGTSQQQQQPHEATPELVSSLISSSTGILSRVIDMIRHSSSIFSQPNPDYRQLSHRIYMLDCAIGSDYAEFMTSIAYVNTLVTQLQALGRRIGARLGALDKTKANEAIQRLWSRLTYGVYQNRKGVADDTNL